MWDTTFYLPCFFNSPWSPSLSLTQKWKKRVAKGQTQLMFSVRRVGFTGEMKECCALVVLFINSWKLNHTQSCFSTASPEMTVLHHAWFVHWSTGHNVWRSCCKQICLIQTHTAHLLLLYSGAMENWRLNWRKSRISRNSTLQRDSSLSFNRPQVWLLLLGAAKTGKCFMDVCLFVRPKEVDCGQLPQWQGCTCGIWKNKVRGR